MTFELNRELVEYIVAPIISAQLFLTILVYFITVRKRIATDYKLYVVFLLTFIIFLIGRIGWVLNYEKVSIIILYFRIGLFMGVGIPALLIAAAKQSGFNNTKTLYLLPFSLGTLLSFLYIFSFDTEKLQIAHNIQVIGAIVQLIIPCSWLIILEIKNKRQINLLAFLLGALLFGISLLIGLLLKPQNFGLFYIGSILSGVIWIWAVFQDIKDMKGRVSLLKDELQILVRSGVGNRTYEIKSLLENLEELSRSNLYIYKMRIREILNMLTDTTIEAGGDTQSLIKRNAALRNAIEVSSDSTQVSKIILNEAVQLSEIVKDIPTQGNSLVIDKAIEYLKLNFTEDLTVDDIAGVVGLSKAYFMREFKKITGYTLNQFQTNLRIENAKRSLCTKTVTETAYSVGYNNPNYFSTVFKRQTGLSPQAFQEANQEN